MANHKALVDAARAVIEQWDKEGGSYPDKGEYPLDDKIEHLRRVLEGNKGGTDVKA